MARSAPACLLLLPLIQACGPAAGPPPVSGADGPSVVRVATWNVHDLFDEVDRVGPPGDLDPVPTPAEVEAKLDRVAAVLERIDADVVLLQEVENAALLDRLAERAGYPEARLLEGNDPRGIDVGLLSRRRVEAYTGHVGEVGPDGRPLWPRDAVEAVVDLGARPLVLVGTHLSSHLSDPDGTRRRLQATRLRALGDAAAAGHPGALVLVGGDLNDEAAAAALLPLLGDGRWIDPDAGVPVGLGFTWSDGAARSALDHLLIAADQAAALVAAGVVGGTDVAAASDHRPVVVDLARP